MCAPPGELAEKDGPIVVVASRPRSGTHLVIDLILNHFKSLSGSPLYVNLDQLLAARLRDGFSADNLKGYVVKTHYPFLVEDNEQINTAVHKLLEHPNLKIIKVERDTDHVLSSMKDMFKSMPTSEEFDSLNTRFDKTWSIRSPYVLDYAQLIDPSSLEHLLEGLSQHIFSRPYQGRLIQLTPKKRRMTVMFHKASTRILGMRAPRISTGIRLSKDRPLKDR